MRKENKLVIHIVDDHLLFREGFRLILSGLPNVIKVVDMSSGQEFINQLRVEVADIVFMDINMPAMDGIETTKNALALEPDLKIVGLSMYSDPLYYKQMIKAGARGFLLKNSDIGEVERTIADVLSGKNYIAQELAMQLVFDGFSSENGETLSDREKEVLYHICKGLPNNQIAKILSLSKRTVDKHRENLLSKTGAGNTAQLVMYAIKHGIITL
ncbi:MAG: response regulator transcription factor [Bacteroidia bacterium]|nr:response regulator transcription factor [Bacteroidia bacterium]